MKAAVLGASGGIGQPLSLLLRKNPLISHLALYDHSKAKGVAADLSHIPSHSKVTGHINGGLQKALEDTKMILIPAGKARQPGMSCRDDLFPLNAKVVMELGKDIAKFAPKDAFILLMTNPLNSTLPILAEVLKREGTLDPRRVFGVSTLDSVRAECFVRPYLTSPPSNPSDVVVPIIGGHSNNTIVPLFSRSQPPSTIPDTDLPALTHRVQHGGEEVVQAKGGFSSATLSMAYAASRLADKIARAVVKGEKDLVESVLLAINDIPDGSKLSIVLGDVEYFSIPVELGPDGATAALSRWDLTSATDYELALLNDCLPELREEIAKGKKVVAQKYDGAAGTDGHDDDGEDALSS